jgi:Skp family chaperone for outer membrane proteins
MMSRKLTEREQENRQVLRIIDRIKTIEKEYGIDLTKRACQRYSLQRAAEKKLDKEISQRERELQALKKKTLR